MAFQRRRKFRRLNGGRRRRVFGRSKRLKRFVKGVVRRMSEVKWVFTSYASGGAIPAGIYNVTELTPAFTQGPDKFQRIGNNIRYKRVTVQGIVQLNAGVAPPMLATMRVILFWSRNTSSPSPGTIFDNASIGAGGINSTLMSQNVRVMKDWRFMVSPIGQGSGVQLSSGRTFKTSRRVNNNVSFTSSANVTPLDPHDRLWLVYGTDATVTTAFPVVNLHARFSYVDI
jgi:hypothetical protein